MLVIFINVQQGYEYVLNKESTERNREILGWSECQLF